MPAAVSSCFSVSPPAPLATMPSAFSTDTGEISTPSVAALSLRSRDRAKAVTASPPAVRSVVVSSACGSISFVSSCARTPQPAMGRIISSASSSAIARFFIDAPPFRFVRIYRRKASGKSFSPR